MDIEALLNALENDQGAFLRLQAQMAGIRLDANETANLDRQLRHMRAEIYRKKYPTLMHREILPQDSSTPIYARTVSTRVLDRVEKAVMIGDEPDNVPMVDVSMTEGETLIGGVATGFKYTHRDMQTAGAPGGINLSNERALVARGSVERKLDDIACVGESRSGLKGFLNDDNVAVLSAPTVDSDTTWAEKAAGVVANGSGPQAILADMYAPINAINVGTNNVEQATDLLLPTELYDLVATTPFSAVGGSDKSILTWFKENNDGQNGAPRIEVKKWWRLDNANAAGTGGRIVAYSKSPDVVTELPVMPFAMLPPQAKGFAWLIFCWALTGGVHVKLPGAIKYLDGAN